MFKATTLSLLGGSVLTAGLAYVYAKRAQLRRIQSQQPAALEPEVGPGGLVLPILDEASLLAEGDDSLLGEGEVDVEIVDIDTLSEDEEPYDATSPDDLGALWLSRATQTSGVHSSAVRDGMALAEPEDDLDPAGRPTDPPEGIETNER